MLLRLNGQATHHRKGTAPQPKPGRQGGYMGMQRPPLRPAEAVKQIAVSSAFTVL